MTGIVRRTLLLLCASALYLLPAAAQQPAEGEWARQFQSPGLDHYVYAIDVAGEDVYFGGAFNWANGQRVNRIARWDGQNWHPVGDGVSDSVFAIAAAPDGSIYAGGAFTHAGGEAVGYVARWDGSSWSSLGGGMDATVKALAVDAAGNVYAGGRFQSAGGVAANHVARWNGTEWKALRGGVDGPVNALVLDDSGALIAGGDFQVADGVAAGLVAKWNDGQWESLDGGLDHRGEPVLALAIEDGNLYVGGGQFIANGRLLGFIAKWTGDAWVDVAFPWGSPVYSLAAGSNGRLYAGTHQIVFVWNEDGWDRLIGFGATVRVLRFDHGRVFMGGDRRREDAFRVSVWSEEDGHSALLGFSPDHLGLSGWPYTISVAENGDVYAGGGFLFAGGTRVNNMARWDGHQWSDLDDGVNGVVYASAFDSRGNLYVAGLFSRAGDIEAHNIARWDGESWSPLANGLDGRVNTIFFDKHGTLYAGGSFRRAGASQAGGVATWDGTEWKAIGAGFDNAVRSLAFHGGTLYAGLRAEEDRGTLVRCDSGCFARWDGESWSTVGEGLYSMGRVYEVHSLVSYGERLLVAASCRTLRSVAPG